VEAQQGLAGGVAPLVDVGGLGEAGEAVGDPGGLEDAGDLVVEVHRARQRVRVGSLLEDHHGPAALRELDAEPPDGPAPTIATPS
jgi:hypothetical protein